jgi:hypothetical protein
MALPNASLLQEDVEGTKVGVLVGKHVGKSTDTIRRSPPRDDNLTAIDANCASLTGVVYT